MSTHPIPIRESGIQRAILDYLAARHILAFRMNTGAVVSEYKGRKRFMRFGTPGMADILAFPRLKSGPQIFTQPWFIEVKSDHGKQSEWQRSFESQVKEHGIEYLLARSVDDVKRQLSDWGLEEICHQNTRTG